eukprot:Nk52_evm5s299 gene=Nk52_evmTU5s299
MVTSASRSSPRSLRKRTTASATADREELVVSGRGGSAKATTGTKKSPRSARKSSTERSTRKSPKSVRVSSVIGRASSESERSIQLGKLPKNFVPPNSGNRNPPSELSSPSFVRRALGKLSKFVFISIVTLYVLVYTIVILFHYNAGFRHFLIFLSPIGQPLKLSYSLTKPELYGFANGRNVEILTKDNVVLKGWHILPPGDSTIEALNYYKNDDSTVSPSFDGLTNEEREKRDRIFDELLIRGNKKLDASNFEPIIIYNHGNAHNRGHYHRVKLCKFLSAHFNAHIVIVDYRGYGDSGFRKQDNVEQGHSASSDAEQQQLPDPENVNLDVRAVWDFLVYEKKVHPKRVLVWGHSLGTALSTRLVHELLDEFNTYYSKNNISEFSEQTTAKLPHHPAGLVLEAPFTNLYEASKGHPLGRPFVDYSWLFPYALELLNMAMIAEKSLNTDERLNDIYSRILDDKSKVSKFGLFIIHSVDDRVVPYSFTEELQRIVESTQSPTRVALKKNIFEVCSFPLGGHNHNYGQLNLLPRLSRFIKAVLNM